MESRFRFLFINSVSCIGVAYGGATAVCTVHEGVRTRRVMLCVARLRRNGSATGKAMHELFTCLRMDICTTSCNYLRFWLRVLDVLHVSRFSRRMRFS